MTASPICVSDTFHYSHYYWREIENDSSDDEEIHKPEPVTKDCIQLKFYVQILGDGMPMRFFSCAC